MSLHLRLWAVNSILVIICAKVWWKLFSCESEQVELGQVCVVRSAHRGPVTSEYNVSGSTYAPDGIILDGAGLKLNILKSYFCCTWPWRSLYLERYADTKTVLCSWSIQPIYRACCISQCALRFATNPLYITIQKEEHTRRLENQQKWLFASFLRR
jgi:hypothetical protein